YPSKDGTKVSMFIIHKKGLPKNGLNPTILYGYGGFNISLTPTFDAMRIPWLEQGGVWAIPNLRGGGEYGESWHQAGMLGQKQNVFDDFVAAAEFLIAEGYTSSQRLGIRGRSNGGLLVGAAMTQRPDLFGAVVCGVPLLDMVRYHKFGIGRAWIPEYGSADSPEQFEWLYAYSPYHRVKEGVAYPPLLMLSADHDDRVDPMHARKFVAAVEHATASPAKPILRIETNSGHGGGDLRSKYAVRAADVLAFFQKMLE
ncbi:MAG: prolyl oligopeptidase family serine peptidase, partial [Myxococcota bacterium]